MLERFGAIRNPLTIIAIFAGIAEISGTAILPYVSPENQASYIEFLKFFPPFLVLLFFATLNFNHRVLYAPSDYKDENNFFKRIGLASRDELNRKIEDDILDEVEEQTSQQACVAVATDAENVLRKSVVDQTPQKVRLFTNKSTEDVRAQYLKAEKLLFEKLSLENPSMLRGVGISDSVGRRNAFFDGLIMEGSKVQAVEFLYFSNGPFNNSRVQTRIRKTLDHAFIAFKQLPEGQQKLFSLKIAIATDGPLDLGLESGRLRRLASSVPFPVEVQVYKLGELEKEFAKLECAN